MRKNKKNWNISNSYTSLPSKLFSVQLPEKSINPKKVIFNFDLAAELGLNDLSELEILDYFSGNIIPPGSISISQAYAGHQFGNFTVLGDGRAILIAEQITPDNIKYDIQLKGSGKTPYSRRGDGKATLSSVLREYIMSESMNYLGIPTSRSLAVINTGEKVYRQEAYDGGILTRVCSSHLRFGTFEYVSNFCSKDEYEIFIEYVIKRHFPHIIDTENPFVDLFDLVMAKQIDLIVNWMRVGFIHGVMNTDNVSIVGETIDYGPCAFMNKYNPNTVFSSIDRNGRYSFGNQPNILHWNLVVFANSLIPMISKNKQKTIELIREKLDLFPTIFSNSWYNMMYKKLGIINPVKKDMYIVDELLRLINTYKSDYTNTFAALTLNIEFDDIIFKIDEFKIWRRIWENRIESSDNSSENYKLMQSQNPVVIPRNYLVEIALENSISGNLEKMYSLLDLLSKSYKYSSEVTLQTPPMGFDESYKTFCGT